MAVLQSVVDTSDEQYRANRATLLALLAAHDDQLALACAGGGERYAARHRARGKLLVRERLELLVDRDASFLELSPLAAWGSPFHVGASIVTGVGVVSGVECLLIGHDPTVRGGTGPRPGRVAMTAGARRECEYHRPTSPRTPIASSAAPANQETDWRPCGMMIQAASNGPIAAPPLPPTWKIDCAKPCRPPDASRAIREDSG